PLEFTVLGFEPEPWTGPDVLAWVKMMAWDLSKNYSMEILKRDATALMGPERAAQLFPPYSPKALTILSEADLPWVSKKTATTEDTVDTEARANKTSVSAVSSVVESSWTRALASAFDLPSLGSALGSNNWVVDGAMTASGKPLLANDPHLDAQIPSLWY